MKRIVSVFHNGDDWTNLGAATLFLIVVIIAFIVVKIVWQPSTDPCYRDIFSYECKVQKFHQCMDGEDFTRDECVSFSGITE